MKNYLTMIMFTSAVIIFFALIGHAALEMAQEFKNLSDAYRARQLEKIHKGDIYEF